MASNIDEEVQRSEMVDTESSPIVIADSLNVAGDPVLSEPRKTFRIDTTKIQSVPQHEQNSELQDLGLQVFNQDTFEQAVLAQVDEMVENEERQRNCRLLNKEISSIDDDIRSCREELIHIDKVLCMLGTGSTASSIDTKHRLMSVKSQRRAVESRLQTLTVRRKIATNKLDALLNDTNMCTGQSSDAVDELAGVGLRRQGEGSQMDSLIQRGEMTPFGTLNVDRTLQNANKQLKTANKLKQQVKLKRKQKSLDKQQPTKNGDDSDWQPTNPDDVYSEEYESSDTEELPKKKSKKGQSVRDGSGDDNELKCNNGRRRKKVHRGEELPVVDDGDEEVFQYRLRRLQKEEVERQRKRALNDGDVELDSGSDMEIDDGFKVPGRIWNKLYRYQKTGVRWLWELHCQQAGGILGDEMGLGKTIQVIGFLAGLHHSKLHDEAEATRYVGLGPVLIVCPATVMHQWVKEFHTWFPAVRVAILHATGSYSTTEAELISHIVKSRGVIVTAYSTVVMRQELLLAKNWHYVFLDEGHKIRNPDAQVTLACKQFRTCHRLILSGSPVQNNLKELWSLFDFVFPGKLGTLPDFMQHFSVPIVQGGYANATQVQVQTAYKCACVLRDTIAPYLLRRMKADVKVNLQLPDKNEQVLFCRLTDEQRQVYQEYLDSKECHQILAGKFMVFPGLITLRKICNHPDLSTGGPKVFGNLGKTSQQETHEVEEYGYWKRSGKMIVIESLLKLWKKQDHKVLLFTQSRQMLDILESFVQERHYSYIRMDGTTSIGSRQTLVSRFNNDESIFVFLLTTRVGGLGINLTGADRVVIFDPDWNPSTDMQARERAWRIGQTRPVTVYRLLTTGTIEEKIYHRQIFKQFLTNRVLKDPKQRRFFKANDMYELFTLGSDSADTATETSAIFAGTNSDVRLRRRHHKAKHGTKHRQNRFDYLKEKERELGLDADAGKVEEKDDSDDEKVTRMKELARRLSQKIFAQRSDSRNSGEKPEQADISTSSPQSNTIAAGTDNCVAETNGKHSEPEMEPSASTSKHVLSDSNCSKKHHKKHKNKHRKQHGEAVVDGEKIVNVERSSVFQPSIESEDQANSQEQDDYVLRRLLRTSVHSAMLHDNIMSSANPDYLLVECEAEKVARDAARALSMSRRLCLSVPLGMPTWTGQNGQIPAKARFGSKKNSSLLTATETSPAQKKHDQQPVKQKNIGDKQSSQFDGSALLLFNPDNVITTNTVLASSDLLEHVRSQNTVVTVPTSANADVPASPDDQPLVTSKPDPRSMELIRDIRDFVACGSSVDGQATTQEILDHFKSRVPSDLTAKFRSMLRQVCTLHKDSGTGLWRLKPDFQ